MSGVILSGDTSGTVTLTVPAVAGTNTITVPAATGTLALTSQIPSGPAFSAYQNGSSTLSSGVATKIPFNTEIFDTANCFDSTTNYRFTPNVAGYYQINITMRVTGSSITNGELVIYKNGSAWLHSMIAWQSSQVIGGMSSLIYLNGSTDYIEAYCYVSGSSLNFNGGGLPYASSITGSMVKGA